MKEYETMERDQLAARIEEEIWRWTREYCAERGLPYLWRRPVVRFGDANSPLFGQLSEIVVEGHHVPQEYLNEATVVISYFLPFTKEVGEGNEDGQFASKAWADGYNISNAMTAEMNGHLVEWLGAQGFAAAVPTDAGMISDEQIVSRWSQKHVAYICGHGTFGVNNMLISDKGCVGRYFSVVANLPVLPHQPVRVDRCIYKKSGKCLRCVRRCVGGALDFEIEEETSCATELRCGCGEGRDAVKITFDRKKCLEQCRENKPVSGAAACGKCVVGLPCSYIE